jgi:hypothetical protein
MQSKNVFLCSQDTTTGACPEPLEFQSTTPVPELGLGGRQGRQPPTTQHMEGGGDVNEGHFLILLFKMHIFLMSENSTLQWHVGSYFVISQVVCVTVKAKASSEQYHTFAGAKQ